MSDVAKRLNVGDLVRFFRSTSPTARANIYVIESVTNREGYGGRNYDVYSIKPVFSFMGARGAQRKKGVEVSELEHVDLIELGKEFMRFQTFIETYVKGKSE